MTFQGKVIVITGGAQGIGKCIAECFAGRVGNPMDIANMVLYLASDKTGFITGENICIDMHLRRSRQVPRRATRGALQSKVARGCEG